MEYTKGKWRVADKWNVLSGRRVVANCGGYTSNVNSESVVNENEANAQLIASAPALYEALKALLERTDKGLPLSRTIHLIPAQQALAKAEGQ